MRFDGHATFAAGLPLPKQLLAHGWWQKDNAKISKSTGNIVDPITVIDEWGLDAFRYFVVRELDIGPDGNWTLPLSSIWNKYFFPLSSTMDPSALRVGNL